MMAPILRFIVMITSFHTLTHATMAYGQSSLDTNQIRSDYKEAYYNALRRANWVESVLPNSWEVGDTITITHCGDGISILPVYTDSVILASFGHPLKAGDQLIVVIGKDSSCTHIPESGYFELRTTGDTIVFGLMSRRDLEYFAQPQIMETKADYYDAFSYYLKMFHDSIRIKNQISTSQLNAIVGDLHIDMEGGWLNDRKGPKERQPIVKASFIGGDVRWLELIRSEYIKNFGVLQNGIFAALTFVVDIHGNVVDLTIYEPIDPDLKVKLTTIILALPKWKPGYHGNTPLVQRKYFDMSWR